MKKLILLLILIVILSGCTGQPKSEVEKAKELCIAKCQEALKNNQDISDGPCLSNQIIEDWVCDVAHFPRIEKDKFPQNQCEAFRAGVAHHFVEVDTQCNIIKVY